MSLVNYLYLVSDTKKPNSIIFGSNQNIKNQQKKYLNKNYKFEMISEQWGHLFLFDQLMLNFNFKKISKSEISVDIDLKNAKKILSDFIKFIPKCDWLIKKQFKS